jgi:O-glycosyl hydrolase
MHTRALIVAAVCGLLAHMGPALGALSVTDGHGRIEAMYLDGDLMGICTNVRIPTREWKTIPNLDDARDVKREGQGAQGRWTGRIEVEPGKSYRYEQMLTEDDGAVRIDLTVTAEADVAIEGVFFWLDAPIEAFAAGNCEVTGGAAPGSAAMAVTKPERPHFLSATGSRVAMVDAPGRTKLEATFDRSRPIVVQDTREWDGTVYSAFVQLNDKQLAKGDSVSMTATLKLTGEADRTPAKLTVDPTKVRYRLDGFGGNYCFGIESPVTQYTLENLRVAWARTEMTPAEWEPRNDNDSPTDTDWTFLESHDRPDSNLRREFLLAQDIQQRGIPYCISIWHLPEWLYAEPGKGPSAHRRRVAPDKWPELLECLGSYLLYAKRQYGVEPDLFSFNEANIGVRVLFTAEEHQEAIKRIGGHFEGLGLKTKMLLADATGARGTHTYALPAANDPEAMRYVGAVGFHSWGGASPEQYAAWGDLAERLKLPLLVAELGVDAGAWRNSSYTTFHYAMREVQMYQEILLHARPQGTMQWEFTSDYGIVNEEKQADGKTVKLVPTVRFWFVKQFCNLTPVNANALATTSDHPKVLLTAFSGESKAGTTYTLHIANLGAGRPATVSGLPMAIDSLDATRTSETESYEALDAVPVRNGTVTLELAAQSLLTLDTRRTVENREP